MNPFYMFWACYYSTVAVCVVSNPIIRALIVQGCIDGTKGIVKTSTRAVQYATMAIIRRVNQRTRRYATPVYIELQDWVVVNDKDWAVQ